MRIRNLLIGGLMLLAALLLIPPLGQAYSLKMTRNEPRETQFWCRDIRIAIAANHHADYTTEELVNAVEATIERFAKLTPISLSIVDTQAASDDPTCSVDNGQCPNAWIGFPPSWDKHDPERAAATLRWFHPTRGEIFASNILFHPDKPFGVVDSANPIAINDLESTLMHEFGHLFGLGHSEYKDACMWGGASVRSETKKRSIHFDDEDGMKAIYTRERLEACGYPIQSGYVFPAEKKVADAFAATGIENPGKTRPEDLAVNLYNRAVGLYSSENWAAAERLAKKAVELDPNLLKAIQMLVWCNQKQGDWEDVLSFGERFLSKDPSNAKVLQVTMHAAKATNNTARLSELKSMMPVSDQVSAADVFDQAVLAINAGDDARAASLLGEAVKLDPDFARSYLELGKIKARSFEFEEAIRYLKMYIRHDPGGRYVKEAEDLIVTLAE